ncbi:glyoxylate/hydroxypyruvate reductase A [Bradyrhizobium yuanmingense]|uniref:2-hydroxyacid dehydrogenase n=1 Tax=Bradyrhizobium yuanmingense TaxID=108015 RepID=UPI0023B9AE2C|nr:glyoxylate/hydroxypyruvate reductase A [Bradyrhizobium yuanmingense]MDF0515841.1 glyoxylate/hydroxypyruvate reductase A [Bradyrhizobium yuanmingense]
MTSEVMAFYSAFDDFETWRDALVAEGIDLRRADDIANPLEVRQALVWKPPHGFFTRYPNLGLVVNLGAGVDALVGRDDLPDVPITRLSDPKMARMMAGYVLFAVTRHARDIPAFERAQREHRWRYIHPRDPETITVGVLGLGELGLTAALECARQGYRVRGWSNTLKSVDGIETSAGLSALPDILRDSDILVCMLPETPQTRGLLDAERLAQMKPGAVFINVSRGSIVDEPALIEALRSAHIAEATLDVFASEPLSPDSPLWAMDNVLVTPHLASVALPRSAARQIGENVRRLRAGQQLLSRVDPRRGY